MNAKALAERAVVRAAMQWYEATIEHLVPKNWSVEAMRLLDRKRNLRLAKLERACARHAALRKGKR